jgi:hypothetical protein
VTSNAYYLTAIYTCAQVRETTGRSGGGDSIQVWDASSDAIVFSASPDEAQRLLERELNKQLEGENPREVTVKKVSVAPIVEQLLTESGNFPLNWAAVLEKADPVLESTPVDDFEQGYWVDVDQVVQPDKLSFSVGTLESEVPEEVRSGLNWSSDKRFFFFLKVLPLPTAPPIPAYEQEPEDIDNERHQEPSQTEIDEMNVILPETVAVIQARNSVAAAWLWRKYAANTQWNTNTIRITSLCGTVGEPV